MTKQQFDILTEKYLNGTATLEERGMLEEYLARISKKDSNDFSESELNKITTTIYGRIENQIESERVEVIPFYKKTAFKIAAAIIIILGLGSYFALYNNTERQSFSNTTPAIKNDVLPGKDGAILTLADGVQIVLDDAANGKLTEVAVKNGNMVTYVNGKTTRVEYNTMTTPKGRQFSLVLADGTQVWLNAASSITYPTAFTGTERRVEITGEVYFEVYHDAVKPFHVNANSMDVQVLGTHFNINSYPDEETITTTLLEGSVKVSKGDNKSLLKPGQQAILNGQNLKVNGDVNMDVIMAWRNGYFSFSNADIKTVMRQLSRWYDVEVIYQGNVPDEKLDGKIPRNVNASSVLGALQYTGLRFKIDGKKIYVAP